jgi:hypothetical protein
MQCRSGDQIGMTRIARGLGRLLEGAPGFLQVVALRQRLAHRQQQFASLPRVGFRRCAQGLQRQPIEPRGFREGEQVARVLGAATRRSGGFIRIAQR